MCESYGVQLRPAVDVLVAPYGVRLLPSQLRVHILFHLSEKQMRRPHLKISNIFTVGKSITEYDRV